MYNIHSHYENIIAYAKSIIAHPKLIYLHPFGSTQPENVEIIDLGGYGPLLFCYDQEPLIPEFNIPIFKHASNYRDDDGRIRFVILLNTEKESDAKNQLLKTFPYIDCYYFFHAFAAADWYRGYQYCADLTLPKERNIKKKYITFNRLTGNSRCYRSFFVSELQKNNLIHFGNISYSHVCPEHGYYRDTIHYASRYNVDVNYINQSIAHLDLIDHPLRIDNVNKEFISNGSQTLNTIPQMMESFLHVVTETCFWEKKKHLTEKIFKPIVARQPFVLLGCANNLQYLKSYGFKTFDSWWDESYDQIEDPIERLQAVVKIIKQICELDNITLQKMLTEMNDTLEYNYHLFYSQDFINYCWQELKFNLKDAIVQLQHQIETKNPALYDFYTQNYR